MAYSTESSVSAIIAAYNEERTIGPVVDALVQSHVFREVIVIADGSTDHTAEIAERAGASYVQCRPLKEGKGAALMQGVSKTAAPILFFCDADIKGFTIEHISVIVDPVLHGNLEMCVGLRDRGTVIMWLCQYLPLIGGERALKREVFERIPYAYLQGYRVETAMNFYCRSHRLPYGTVYLHGVTLRRKMQKVGIWKGFREYIAEAGEVIWAMILVRFAHARGQFVRTSL